MTTTAVSMDRGDTYPLEFQIKDSKTKLPYNLTGATLEMEVQATKNPAEDVDPLFTVTGVVTNPSKGLVTFTPTAEETTPPGKYFYEIRLTTPDGSIRTILKNTFSVT